MLIFGVVEHDQRALAKEIVRIGGSKVDVIKIAILEVD